MKLPCIDKIKEMNLKRKVKWWNGKVAQANGCFKVKVDGSVELLKSSYLVVDLLDHLDQRITDPLFQKIAYKIDKHIFISYIKSFLFSVHFTISSLVRFSFRSWGKRYASGSSSVPAVEKIILLLLLSLLLLLLLLLMIYFCLAYNK